MTAKSNTNLFFHSSGSQKVKISIAKMGSPQGFKDNTFCFLSSRCFWLVTTALKARRSASLHLLYFQGSVSPRMDTYNYIWGLSLNPNWSHQEILSHIGRHPHKGWHLALLRIRSWLFSWDPKTEKKNTSGKASKQITPAKCLKWPFN